MGEQLISLRETVALTPEQTQQLLIQTQETNRQMVEMMQQMASSLRVMNEQVVQLTRQMQAQAMQMPVSSKQRTQLNGAIRDRAAVLGSEMGWPDGDKRFRMLAALIRADIRGKIAMASGRSIRGLGDVPACQFQVAMRQVGMWEEFDAIDRIDRK